jgi:hypothetical protein
LPKRSGSEIFRSPSAAKPAAQPTSATAPQKPQKPTSQKQQCQSQYQQTVSAAQSKRTKQFLTFFTAVGVPGDILLGGCFFTEELMVPCMEGVETALGGPSVTAAVAFEHQYNSTVNNARQQMQACQEAEPGGIQ